MDIKNWTLNPRYDLCNTIHCFQNPRDVRWRWVPHDVLSLHEVVSITPVLLGNVSRVSKSAATDVINDDELSHRPKY